MCAKWAEPTSPTIKVPSIQTILLIVLLAGAIVAIVWASVAVQLATPTVSVEPDAGTEEGPAAWMSAWSTFWGAVAGGIGAIGTAGALLLGAFTFRRQVQDQHRTQAAAISVGIRTIREYSDIGERKIWYQYFVRNDSLLPIYHVRLYFGPVEERRKTDREVIPPGDEVTHDSQNSDFMAFGKFVDSPGVAWKRDGSGKLIEIKNNDGQPWTMD